MRVNFSEESFLFNYSTHSHGEIKRHANVFDVCWLVILMINHEQIPLNNY